MRVIVDGWLEFILSGLSAREVKASSSHIGAPHGAPRRDTRRISHFAFSTNSTAVQYSYLPRAHTDKGTERPATRFRPSATQHYTPLESLSLSAQREPCSLAPLSLHHRCSASLKSPQLSPLSHIHREKEKKPPPPCCRKSPRGKFRARARS